MCLQARAHAAQCWTEDFRQGFCSKAAGRAGDIGPGMRPRRALGSGAHLTRRTCGNVAVANVASSQPAAQMNDENVRSDVCVARRDPGAIPSSVHTSTCPTAASRTTVTTIEASRTAVEVLAIRIALLDVKNVLEQRRHVCHAPPAGCASTRSGAAGPG